jgi:DNA-binding transcriptional ArsR family regulator
VLSRHNFHRTYQAALAKLADPTGELRPTAARVLKALRAGGRPTTGQLVATLAEQGRAIRPATVRVALDELVAAELVADVGEDGQQRWLALRTAPDPLLEAVDLHGAHDFRHAFATWLEDAGIPARVIDEVMGHEATSRPASSAAAPWAPTTGTPPPRWPPASRRRSSSASRSCWRSLSRPLRPTKLLNTASVLATTGRVFWQISGKWRSERVWKLRCAWWS